MTWAVAGVTLLCFAVAVAVYEDRSVRRLMADYYAAQDPAPLDRGTHHTPRGGAM